MTIDVHNHLYPRGYLEELKRRPGVARLEYPSDREDPILAYEGDYNVLVRGHRDAAYRLEEMQRCGIEMQILSLTTPGVHVEERAWGIQLAEVTNDEFAEICRRFPERFRAFAALPLQDPEAAAMELERSVSDLGLVGGLLFSNVNGVYPDAASFEPLYAKAEELGVPLFVHPTTPAQPQAVLDYRLVASIGFLMDTTTAIARMILAGTLDRHPSLRLIAAHLGGTLPYVQERLDRCWEAFPEIHDGIEQAPSAYLRSNVYYDSVAFDVNSLELARSFVGSRQLVLGSDYPHQIGDLNRSVATVQDLEWPEKDRMALLRGNAVELLAL